ncbi:NADP(H)-dependent aldo-keto reductase [Gammaproteobacteria bacterium]|nr:NADP(H)-dependent aldo-keto reductase [Gammaproteobacteria bacterium]|tara:strand:+ start:13 stop:1056 length:1044 start_codon:yes stop_codon:yes gene_type:complete
MIYSKLGHTNIEVSKICLGTMTFGEQNTEKEAHEQLDFALEHGVNFIDTAEMYPVPPNSKTQGLTEKYIGSWLKKRNNRDDVIIASKVTGPAPDFSYIRNSLKIDKKNIEKAIAENLKRLNTDYIDLYQIHWPQRQTNYFGQLNYKYSKENTNEIIDNLNESYEALNNLVESGKIRSIGLSNDTSWGAMKFLEISKEKSFSKIVTIQNPYSLLNRTYEINMAEISEMENIKLLAYSPLGFGVLTGKYINNKPKNSRLSLWNRFDRYSNKNSKYSTLKYVELAKKYNITPTQLALSFVNQQPFVTSNIIGATNLSQLTENIKSIDLILNEEIINEIESIHLSQPNPAP